MLEYDGKERNHWLRLDAALGWQFRLVLRWPPAGDRPDDEWMGHVVRRL